MAKEEKKNGFEANKGRLKNLSKEERQEFARKGGLGRKKKIDAQKSLAQIAKAMMTSGIKKDDAERIMDVVPDFEQDDMTVGALVVYGMVTAAMNGNPKAFEQLMNLEGAVEKQGGELDKLTQALHEVGKYL